MRRFTLTLATLAALAASVTVYTAYKGHADDRDVNAILETYPALKNTPADSCATCHKSGTVVEIGTKTPRAENHCDYCHAVYVRDHRDPVETLNTFGAAYLAAGRNAAAVKAVASKDSDGDGFSNEVELSRGTNPGDPVSNPKAPVAPSRSYTVAALRALSPTVERTIFLNTTKSRSGDSYSAYRGNDAWAMLQGMGIAASATSVDFLSADGYERTYTVEELKKSWPQGAPVMGLGSSDIGACGWVHYNVPGLEGGKPLAPSPIMIAFEENGQPLKPSSLDPATGRIVGQAPMRVVVPQSEISGPDLSQTADPSCASKVPEAARFHEAYDHNGGKSSFAIVAIRVKPLPKGTRDADWQTGALSRLTTGEVMVFGALR